MEKVKIPILIVTLFAIVYNAIPFFEPGSPFIIFLYAVAPFPVIWLAYQVLKFGVPGDKKWDDYFYEDYPYRRNGREEMEDL